MDFNHVILSFFIQQFHIVEPSALLLQQPKLRTSRAGMGLLSLTDSAPGAYLGSVHNLLTKFSRSGNSFRTPAGTINSWSLGALSKVKGDVYNKLINQICNQGNRPTWRSDALFALPPPIAQHFLSSKYLDALFHSLDILKPKNQKLE